MKTFTSNADEIDAADARRKLFAERCRRKQEQQRHYERLVNTVKAQMAQSPITTREMSPSSICVSPSRTYGFDIPQHLVTAEIPLCLTGQSPRAATPDSADALVIGKRRRAPEASVRKAVSDDEASENSDWGDDETSDSGDEMDAEPSPQRRASRRNGASPRHRSSVDLSTVRCSWFSRCVIDL